ncbi:hypothetical protein ACFQH6_01710 [Halobacteriaceae archaeon GCM10025711]
MFLGTEGEGDAADEFDLAEFDAEDDEHRDGRAEEDGGRVGIRVHRVDGEARDEECVEDAFDGLPAVDWHVLSDPPVVVGYAVCWVCCDGHE